MILQKIQKLANQLDEAGYFEEAGDLTEILEAAALESLLRKNAAALELRISVDEQPEQNQWLANFNIWKDGALQIANLEQVSSPIYQTEDLRAAGNKQAGIDAMKGELRKHLKDFRRRHPEYIRIAVIIENPLFR